MSQWSLPNITNFVISVTALIGMLLTAYHTIANRFANKANKEAIAANAKVSADNHAASTAAIAAANATIGTVALAVPPIASPSEAVMKMDEVLSAVKALTPVQTQTAGPTTNINVTAPVEVTKEKPPTPFTAAGTGGQALT